MSRRKRTLAALLLALAALVGSACEPTTSTECYVLPHPSLFAQGVELDYDGRVNTWYVEGAYYGVAVEEDSRVTTC